MQLLIYVLATIFGWFMNFRRKQVIRLVILEQMLIYCINHARYYFVLIWLILAFLCVYVPFVSTCLHDSLYDNHTTVLILMKWSKRALVGDADSDEYTIFKSVLIFKYYFYQISEWKPTQKISSANLNNVSAVKIYFLSSYPECSVNSKTSLGVSKV